jgi:hypothetical protein
LGRTLAELPSAAFVYDAGRRYPVRKGSKNKPKDLPTPKLRGRTAGLFSCGCFAYLERVAAPITRLHDLLSR